MAMDQLREEYNKDGQKVVFIATSDDFHWIKKHLVDKQARFFLDDIITSFPKWVFGHTSYLSQAPQAVPV